MPTVSLNFDNSFVREFPELCQAWSAQDVESPRTLLVNDDVARTLGLDPSFLATTNGARFLCGMDVPDGAQPVAQAYAGHQFGNYSPRLGDGRALLIGEILDIDGRRRDLHLKGSGRTPFARGGDGKAAIGPMVREFILGEAMYGLGIPSTRALGVVATGEMVTRETFLPGAVLARVAASHVRVGTFQFAAALHSPDLVRRLADHSIERHGYVVADGPDRYLSFLEGVMIRQAELIAQWMLVGFVHGVMNTDNMTISGETIDFGPCAFIDRFDPMAVFSSIDETGRYAFGNQPHIGQWNLARLAETLLPLIDDDPDSSVSKAMAVLEQYPIIHDRAWLRGASAKLALITDAPDPDVEGRLFGDLLALMHTNSLDYTSTFRLLADTLSPELAENARDRLRSACTDVSVLEQWISRWSDVRERHTTDHARARTLMNSVNPLYIARNHKVEEALAAAINGDLSPTLRLVDHLRAPFTENARSTDLTEPAPHEFGRYRTFCGT